MKIKKGEIVLVNDGRKLPSRYKAKAIRDFDTENNEWYDLILEEPNEVKSLNTAWFKGEELPCRKGLCKISKIM